MENLKKRFDVLQDLLMNIYEQGSDTLESQIEHWQALRREAVLLYYARQNGVLRLGYLPVPPLATSEAKAKQAISMVLQLQSLQQSPYGTEKWTLVDTSIETFKNTPENHFKKGPINVEVIYDGDPDNANLYTMWKYVYYMDDNDQWQKTESGANHTGIYYLIGEFKHYYVLFADDANRYSKSGQWEVRINKETVFAPVTSSTPPDSPGGSRELPGSTANSKASSPTQQPQQACSDETTKRKRYGRRESSPTDSRCRRRSSSRQKKQGRRARSRTRSRCSSTQTRSRSTSRRSRSTSRGNRRCRGDTPRGQRGVSTSSRGRGRGSRRSSSSSSPTPRTKASQRGCDTRSVRDSGISPGDVGRKLQTVSGRNSGRLGRLLEEALDPPVILLRGGANTLKCFRNRAKLRYRGHYKAFSTSWSWVAADGTERLGRSRLLVSFTSFKQRSGFLDLVRFPKGVDWSLGSFDKL
ncbi:regulatory protein E2 [human papillomavirus 24]|uniref:Regulatory protein E2 n=1 Tax=Human papillomavirus 24 TaxID=37956 RepID=VE2_HPV24|nr:RecName: Full=Regulatory protein E2 [human papillomavirus 24]AAA79418.1 regulatory protein E2 [human papillomavirus 24]